MKRYIIILLFSLLSLNSFADVIAKPLEERLVNDFAGIITNHNQIELLEDSLRRYARRTSTQIVVVTINDLEGYDVAEYAYKIGQTWGIGQKGKNNGVVILVKPKRNNSDRGRAFIASGYGLESVLPDITCSRIVNDVMIPYFKQDDYQSGVIAGAVAVMKACEGEFEGDPDGAEMGGEIGLGLFIFLMLLILFMLGGDSKKGKNNRMSGGGGLTEAMIIGSLLRNSSRSSGWGSFSSGTGSFGGFGGGSFGGGGGGGSW